MQAYLGFYFDRKSTYEHIDAKLLLNSSSYVNRSVNFWGDVDVLLIYCLYIAYQLDFETFDFDPVEYLKTKDLPEKAKKLLLP